MKLFGHDFQGAAKVLVIFVAVFLVASGLCGLEIAIASQLKTEAASNLIPLGILNLIVLVVSGLGIVVMLLFMLVRAIVRSSSEPANDHPSIPSKDDGDLKK